MNNMGVMYQDGKGVPQDNQKAFEWYLRAHNKAMPKPSLMSLLCMLMAQAWRKMINKRCNGIAKAAEQNHADAQVNLGYAYAYGKGVAKNEKQAAHWYQKSGCAKRNAKAQFNLYSLGEGVEKDDKQAVYWYQKAVTQNHVASQLNLGYAYAHGKGISTNNQQAAEWYQKAAEQGNAKAQFNLAILYANGFGVPQSDQLAFE